MKKLFKVIIALLLVTNLFSCTKQQNNIPNKNEAAFRTTIKDIEKYGNLVLDTNGYEFFKSGFDYGDVVNVNINNTDYEMPIGSNYSDVAQGEMICRVEIDSNNNDNFGKVIIAINMGDFATFVKIATKTKIDDEPGFKWEYIINEPYDVYISMKEKSGYIENFISNSLGLSRTNNRDDYANLTDEEFANFRMIKTSNINDGILFRSSSPINPFINRNKYADIAMEAANIKSVINLADNEMKMKAYNRFEESYYSTIKIIPLDLSIDFKAKEFKEGIVKAIKFIAENEGPYLIHCDEGKDRAGYMSAIIECLMGATADEVVKDYMITYYNYYKVGENDERYNTIKTKNIEDTLERTFDVNSIYGIDLKKECESFLISIGLTNSDIEAAQYKLQK